MCAVHFIEYAFNNHSNDFVFIENQRLKIQFLSRNRIIFYKNHYYCIAKTCFPENHFFLNDNFGSANQIEISKSMNFIRI